MELFFSLLKAFFHPDLRAFGLAHFNQREKRSRDNETTCRGHSPECRRRGIGPEPSGLTRRYQPTWYRHWFPPRMRLIPRQQFQQAPRNRCLSPSDAGWCQWQSLWRPLIIHTRRPSVWHVIGYGSSLHDVSRGVTDRSSQMRQHGRFLRSTYLVQPPR